MLTCLRPIVPEKGARIEVLAMRAFMSSASASATLRLFTASSSAWFEMKPLLRKSIERSCLVFESVRFALARSRSACCTESSSLTSTSPWPTRSPSRKRIRSTRPATSGRSTTVSSERRLPTAVSAWGRLTIATFEASTAIPGGALAAATGAAGEAGALRVPAQ